MIRDTTGDGIEDWVAPELRVPVAQRAEVDNEDRDMEDNGEAQAEEGAENEDEDMDDEDEDSDVEIRSVGIELNERLRAAVAQREAGNAATVMDEEWEQWLKDAVEAGGIPFLSSDLSPNANIPGTRPASDTQTMHPRLLNAARLGQWQQIPDFLQDMVRQNIEANNRRMEDSEASTSSPRSSSNFSARLSAPARARAVPIPNTTTGRIDARTVARLDADFSRILPPLPTGRVAPSNPPRLSRGPLTDNTS